MDWAQAYLSQAILDDQLSICPKLSFRLMPERTEEICVPGMEEQDLFTIS